MYTNEIKLTYDNIIERYRSLSVYITINTYLQKLIHFAEKLVVQRISLMMFKFNIDEVP